jgi:NADH-quinone oxidoreductase subunit L
MTAPLVILAFFGVTYGWVGIPEDFPILGGLIPNWFHEFVGGTLAEHPPVLEFNWVPLLTSLVVALGGLFLGWLTYRNVTSVEQDKFQIPVLKNKYYFDEAYDFLFIKPSIWFSEVFVSQWMDKGFIDGILHIFGPTASGIGSAIRNYFDVPVINRFIGDGSADATYWVGKNLRPIQTGRIQQYLLLSMAVIFVIGGLVYFLLLA